jgi:hypothetical protein
MGAQSYGPRALAGFFGLALGIVLLFGAVALVALRPTDGLAWVQVPDLAADLRLDAGLQTKPLKNTVIAEALRDQGLSGINDTSLAVSPALAVAAPPSMVALRPSPSSRPVITPPTSPAATPTPVVTPAPSPTPIPTATATPAPTPTPTSMPTPTPSPSPTPTPSAAPTPRFAITLGTESVKKSAKNGNNNGNTGRCSQTTVTATGNFTTNGVGGWVFYEWVRVDSQGNRTVIPEAPIRIAAGDTGTHVVATDTFTPQHGGTDQLVFLAPNYTVPAQSWSCIG